MENETKQPLSKEGIDRIKFALGFLINYSESLIKKLEDKKLTWSERVGLIIDLTPLMEIVKNRLELVEQLKDLDTDEFNELKNFAVVEFNINNEIAEKRVKKCLNVLSSIFELITDW